MNKSSKDQDRAKRLAQQLRANLQKRKKQQKSRNDNKPKEQEEKKQEN